MEGVGITPIAENMVDNRLQMFGNLERRHVNFCGKESRSDGKESNN